MGIGDLLAEITGEAPSPTIHVPAPLPSLKRNAEGDLKRSGDKIARNDSVPANSTRPISQFKKPQSVTATSFDPKPKPKPSASHATSSNATSSSKLHGMASQHASPAGSLKPDILAKPPKKGSFAEIMARGKVAHAALGPIGKIQHKAIKSTINPASKRERQDDKDQREIIRGVSSAKIAKGKPSSESHLKDGRNGARENNGNASRNTTPVAEKKPRKVPHATTGYTGTARSNPALAKSKPATASRNAYSTGHQGSSRRHYDVSDEEDGEDDDEEVYDSEGSSDMEAAAFEVDEEEERAALIARREDAEALREENRLKREKEEKKRRLAAMAEARR